MKKAIVLNGKFLMAAPTGVHRVAEELIYALDAELSENTALRSSYDISLFAPKRLHHRMTLQNIRFEQGGIFSWIPWEQLDLPRYRPGATRISLCNLGPVLSRNAVTMFHDAQVYISPASYSKPFRLWYKFIQPLIGRRHKALLTVSGYSREQLAKFGVAQKDKITVIHNGVDHILRVPAKPAAVEKYGLEPRRYVLSLANAQAHKNIQVLLKAFRSEALQTTKLVLFGAASRDSLEALIGGPLSENVILAGKIDDGELRGLIESALCLAFPSTTEGFGLPPLEAMLLGCPAIVAPAGALPEVCGDATMYADPFDPADWVRCIRSLSDDSGVWEEWSAKAREQAKPFTWRNAARKLLTVI